MQLKNGHAAAMDKRVDLGSLFCMIGRHGPAVAVAVIAVVSVLAGFFIYRNVKGKRRKAADGDATSQPEGESNPPESRGSVPSTDGSTEDLFIYKEVNSPQSSIRNRRTVTDKQASPPRPAEKISGHAETPTSSLEQDSETMAEPCSQDSDETLKDDRTMAEMDVASCDHGSKTHLSQSKPGNRGNRQDQNEVPNLLEDEILEKLSNANTREEKVEWLTTSCAGVKISQEADRKQCTTTSSRGRGLEEPALDADQSKAAEVECKADELHDESLGKLDQLVTSEVEIGEVIEEVEAHLNDDPVNVLDSPQQTGPENGQEEGSEGMLAPSDQQKLLSMGPGPLILSQPPDLQDPCVADPLSAVSQVEREAGDERWCKDTESVLLMGTKETQGDEIERDYDQSVDRLVPSPCDVPEEAFFVELVTSSEMGRTVDSFGEQNNIQTAITDLRNAGPVSAPNINADHVCPIEFEKTEMTWSFGAGEESGISSMTVSPDLQEPDYDLPTENMVPSVAGLYPGFGEQTGAQNKLYDDDDKAAGEIRKDAISSFGACLALPHIEDHTKVCTNCEERTVMGQFPTDVKGRAENGENTVDEGKTEISIMEATMDTNEWMTDGNEANPWVSPRVPTVDHRDSSPSEAETSPHKVNIDESIEKWKKVAAVQPMSQDVHVSFHIHYVTQSPYQKVAITGNKQELGNWKGFVPLEKTKDGHWATVVSLPAQSHVEWKFVVVDKGEVCRWEECGNRLLETGSGDDLLLQKWWGFL